jgi:hypothetical protein
MSRLARPVKVVCTSTEQPFSNFDFVDSHFQGSAPIRRLFSRARSRKFKTVVVETIPAEGAVADEVEELKALCPDYRLLGLKRISFWSEPVPDASALSAMPAEAFLGWAILKHDAATFRGQEVDRWHVFESVIPKYSHHHNYAPDAPSIPVQIGDRSFPLALPGWLYCQQNGLNKCCAHVALRTLLTARLSDHELPYSRINKLLPHPPGGPRPDWLPRDGLFPEQIETVLRGLGVPFESIYYPQRPEVENARRTLPYQKLLYSGAEAGVGALLAFKLDGPNAVGGHIIPIFGHTFNEDTWAPRSEGAYFRLGEKIRYIPSEAWLSSFLIHDDNFGSDLCLPKRFVRRRHADYVVALLPMGYACPAYAAEVVASRFFYSLIPRLTGTENVWLDRLLGFVAQRELILRTVPVSKAVYLDHLSSRRDWEKNQEDPELIEALTPLLREHLWMVEVSVPDLFSSNLRKLGEILLDGGQSLTASTLYSSFVMGRFPGRFLLFLGQDTTGNPEFAAVPSALVSHTGLLIRQ